MCVADRMWGKFFYSGECGSGLILVEECLLHYIIFSSCFISKSFSFSYVVRPSFLLPDG